MRVTSLQQNVLFATHHKECGTQREAEEAFKIDVPAIHDIERTRLRNELIEDIDIVRFAFGNADKRRDTAV